MAVSCSRGATDALSPVQKVLNWTRLVINLAHTVAYCEFIGVSLSTVTIFPRAGEDLVYSHHIHELWLDAVNQSLCRAWIIFYIQLLLTSTIYSLKWGVMLWLSRNSETIIKYAALLVRYEEQWTHVRCYRVRYRCLTSYRKMKYSSLYFIFMFSYWQLCLLAAIVLFVIWVEFRSIAWRTFCFYRAYYTYWVALLLRFGHGLQQLPER